MKLLKYSAYMAGAALFAFSSGCVAYKPPPDIIHANNYTAESMKVQRVLPSAYKEMGVKDAINIALTNNPTYQTARLAMIKAWAAYYGSLNAFTPNIGVGFGATQTGTYGIGGNSYYTQFNGGVGSNGANGAGAAYNVFNGLMDTMYAMNQLASAKSAEELNKDARRKLVLNVKLAYFQILKDKATIQIQQANEMFQEQQVNETQLKYDAGASSLADLLNWKVKRNDAQVAVINAKAAYAVDKYALAALLGLTSSEIPDSIDFPDIDVIEDQGYSLGVEFYISVAVSQRPDLQSSREMVKAYKYSLYQTWGAFSPTASINWGYTYTSNTAKIPGTITTSGGNPNYTNSYGFNTNWTIWDGNNTASGTSGGGGSRITNVRKAQADYDTSQETLLATWIGVAQNVRTAYTNLVAAIATKKINGATLSMSKERRDLVRDGYNAGNTDIAVLNGAQNDLVTVEQAYVTSIINVATFKANLDAACGLRD